jgi:hypothetical protein
MMTTTRIPIATTIPATFTQRGMPVDDLRSYSMPPSSPASGNWDLSVMCGSLRCRWLRKSGTSMAAASRRLVPVAP